MKNFGLQIADYGLDGGIGDRAHDDAHNALPAACGLAVARPGRSCRAARIHPSFRNPKSAFRNRSRGVGLVELLIALTISASILGAVAVAMDASFKAYAINQQQAQLGQRARVVMHRLLTTVRQAREHQPVTASLVAQFSIGRNVTDTGLSLFTTEGTEISYFLDTDTNKLMMTVGGNDRVLLYGVTRFDVTFEPMRSASSIKTGGNYDLLKRATFVVTVASTDATTSIGEEQGAANFTLSSSVMPRRNVW